MSERFEVVQTLIRGKQSVKKTINKKGEEKVTHHKLPLGYVLRDLTNNELMAVSHLEAAKYAAKYGMTNAQIVMGSSQSGGKVEFSPYIKSAAGHPPLQDPIYVIDIDRYLTDNKNVRTSKALAESLIKTARAKTTGKKAEPRYTREQLLEIIEKKEAEMRAELNTKI